MKLSRHAPTDRQIVQRYGNGGFRVSGVEFIGAVMILPDTTSSWPFKSLESLNIDAFKPVLAIAEKLDVFLIGCGERMKPLNRDLHSELLDLGLIVETMGTGSACRSYNVLVTEGRSVAAALIEI
ncbi:MAG: hypothetical protein CMG46_03655 [Candidatus Marinimicrobia bacterium]|nr:hypothetical protein [Candidatus Neomarinimicrobiota bacterium]